MLLIFTALLYLQITDMECTQAFFISDLKEAWSGISGEKKVSTFNLTFPGLRIVTYWAQLSKKDSGIFPHLTEKHLMPRGMLTLTQLLC